MVHSFEEGIAALIQILFFNVVLLFFHPHVPQNVFPSLYLLRQLYLTSLRVKLTSQTLAKIKQNIFYAQNFLAYKQQAILRAAIIHPPLVPIAYTK
jgi:hypothetical protein